MSSKESRLIIFLIVFVDLLGFGVMIPMLPFYARSFGATAFEVGLLMFSYSAVQVFTAPLWGRLSDRYGRRPILLSTLLGQAIAFLLAGLAPNLGLLLASRSLAGFFAGNISTASAYMADITSPEERAKGMGLIGAAFGLGFVFGPAIGGLLIPYGYDWPSYAAACLSGVSFLLAVFLLKEPLSRKEERENNRRRFSLFDVQSVLKRSVLLVPIILFFLLTFAFTQMEISFGLYVFDRFQMTERQAGLLLAGVGLAMAFVQGGAIGPLVKRFRERKLILVGELILALGLFGIAGSPNLRFFFLSLLALAFGYSITNPCLNAVTSKAAGPEKQGMVLGIYQSAGGLARVAGPLVAGWAYDQGRVFPFLIASGVCIFSIFIWLGFSKSEPSV